MSITKTQKKNEKQEVKANAKSGESVDTLTLLADELLGLMSTKARSKVSYNQEDDAYVVDIEAEDEAGLLIGKKGETLASIQVILGVLLKQKIGEWLRVVVNVGDYREKEEDYLRNLGLSAASRAKETNEPQSLYNLTPAQRRIVHMVLAEDTEVITESLGEGPERYLVVKSKN